MTSHRTTLRRFAALALALATTLLTAGLALAEGGGGPFPR
jgi:hypothetical protein